MSRLRVFLEFKDRLIFQKIYKKLTDEELQMTLKFLIDNSGLDRNAFADRANRWLLDKPKPENFSSMWALITEANSISK